MEENNTSGHVIEMVDVAIHHRGNPVLEKVSFAVDPGEFIYLIGKTGTGKTSLLRIMYADLAIAEGQGKVAGFDLSTIKDKEVPFLRRKLGIVFQDFQLLTDRSVEENLKFVMKATGWKDKAKMDERVHELLTLIGIPDQGKKMPHQLSGGEQQRVSVARALVNEPEIILADEPTGNLDPETSAEILQLLIDISKKGTAVLCATHNYNFFEQHQARTLKCDRGYLVDTLQKVGPEDF
jgi:cell division transport system ATP-binding protein